MSPVQIWVLASFDAKSVVSFISPDAGTDRVFDNADSFAMVFDRTWKQLRSRGNGDVSHVDHLEAVFAAMASLAAALHAVDGVGARHADGGACGRGCTDERNRCVR